MTSTAGSACLVAPLGYLPEYLGSPPRGLHLLLPGFDKSEHFKLEETKAADLLKPSFRNYTVSLPQHCGGQKQFTGRAQSQRQGIETSLFDGKDSQPPLTQHNW